MDELIYNYTREQAIKDGIFVDVSEIAKQSGFKIPVAITINLFNSYIQKDNNTETVTCLKNFLKKIYQKILINNPDSNTMYTKIDFDNKSVDVWLVIEPQSITDISPAMTIMLPEDY